MPLELFLGSLNKQTRRHDLEDIFSKYGRITRCEIKNTNGNLTILLLFVYLRQQQNLIEFDFFEGYAGTAYGFIGFDDERDAKVNINQKYHQFFCF
jgi:RNA recognition motif-containing protein